jgi:hypothetical protein
MARLIVVIGPVSKRYISFVALKMLSGNLLRIENRKGYLWNSKLERCALHNYTQATETGPINRFSPKHLFQALRLPLPAFFHVFHSSRPVPVVVTAYIPYHL